MFLATCGFLETTAADLMSRDVIVLPQQMSLKGAAHRLLQAGVHGAPVVDDRGRCVGMLSFTDLVRCLDADARPLPVEEEMYSPWQLTALDQLPADEVRQHMTRELVTVSPHTTLGEVARQMLRGRVHRLLVLDDAGRPVGVLGTTDVLAAVAEFAAREQTLGRF